MRRRDRLPLRADRRDPGRPAARILVLDDLRHSYVDLRDPRLLGFAYTRWIGDAIDGMAPPERRLDAVFLGGGGFTLPRWLAATRPGSRSRVLEVDAALVGLARERLGLRTGPALRVRTGDARVTLRDEPTASADLVVGDAFGGRSLPWHLATIEFAADVRRVLRPRGLYALNVIDAGPLDLVRAVGATLLAAFPDVALVARPAPAGARARATSSSSPPRRRSPPPSATTARGARTYDRAAVARLAAGRDPCCATTTHRPTSCSPRLSPPAGAVGRATTGSEVRTMTTPRGACSISRCVVPMEVHAPRTPRRRRCHAHRRR